jgi:hypothetical protein
MEPCLICISEKECLSCVGNLFLFAGNNSCLELCPFGFVGMGINGMDRQCI